jgi:hypothetical protein
MAAKKVAKSADAARKSAMTATVVKKVSPDVKIIKAGSKPLTQSLTEKRAIMEKAKGKTPEARAKAAEKARVAKKNLQRDLAEIRRYAGRDAAREALKRAGFDVSKASFGDKPTAAQTKAANKAKAESDRQFKKTAAERKAAAKKNAGPKAPKGGGGMRGPLGGFGGGGVGGPFGKMD